MFANALLFVRVLCDYFKSRRRLEAEKQSARRTGASTHISPISCAE
jgi:hypothetical protein